VPLGHIQRSQRARVRHQVLHLPSAPHGVEPCLSVDAVASTQAPQGVVEPVAIQDGSDRHGLVVGLRLAEMTQELGPAASARAVLSDFFEGGESGHCRSSSTIEICSGLSSAAGNREILTSFPSESVKTMYRQVWPQDLMRRSARTLTI
jgi:hypothetical protein